MKKHLPRKVQISKKDITTTQECHISKLNDDCLINILKQLSIKDRISSERGMFLSLKHEKKIFFKLKILKFKVEIALL